MNDDEEYKAPLNNESAKNLMKRVANRMKNRPRVVSEKKKVKELFLIVIRAINIDENRDCIASLI